MIYSEEDKRLVDQYKQTNIALRKQLSNLNNEIDRILIKRSDKIGLQKLPNVNKKITDPTVMQHEIQNLKKRLDHLERDAEVYRAKSSINYYQKIKQLEAQIQGKDNEMEECRKTIKLYERKDKIANVQASKNLATKSDQRIAKLQEEISRCQKMQKDLIRQINYQEVTQHKTTGYIQELAVKHNEAAMKKQKELREKSPPPQQPVTLRTKTSIGEQEWQQLKKQFLVFKESKQNEQFALNEQNERLRLEVKQWERKIKEKRKRIESLMENAEKNKDRQSRVYSTLADPSNSQSKVYRYRDRNNSIQYNTKQ